MLSFSKPKFSRMASINQNGSTHINVMQSDLQDAQIDQSGGIVNKRKAAFNGSTPVKRQCTEDKRDNGWDGDRYIAEQPLSVRHEMAVKNICEWMKAHERDVSILKNIQYLKWAGLLNPYFDASKCVDEVAGKCAATTKSIRVRTSGFAVYNVEIPTPLGGQVLIKVLREDVNKHVDSGGEVVPRCIARVVGFGPNVDESSMGYWKDARVVLKKTYDCGNCHHCVYQAGTCLNPQYYSAKRQNRLEGFYVVPLMALVKVPMKLESKFAIMVYSMAMVLAFRIAAQSAMFQKDNIRLCIIGDTMVGKLLMNLMEREAHYVVLASSKLVQEEEPSDANLRHCNFAQLEKLEPFDIAIDCTYTGDGTGLALKCAKPLGTVLITSTKSERTKNMDTSLIVVNELKLVGVQPVELQAALQFLRRQEKLRISKSRWSLDLEPFLRTELSLSQLVNAKPLRENDRIQLVIES